MFLRTILINDTSKNWWEFPQNTSITFTKANKICPEIKCLTQFEGVSLNINPNTDELFIAGSLKIEDKKASTSD
jgi:hypothetical protein